MLLSLSIPIVIILLMIFVRKNRKQVIQTLPFIGFVKGGEPNKTESVMKDDSYDADVEDIDDGGIIDE